MACTFKYVCLRRLYVYVQVYSCKQLVKVVIVNE